MGPALGFWGLHVGLTAVLGCPHVVLTVGVSVGVSPWGWRGVRGLGWPHMDPAMGFWGLHMGLSAVLRCRGDPIWV